MRSDQGVEGQARRGWRRGALTLALLAALVGTAVASRLPEEADGRPISAGGATSTTSTTLAPPELGAPRTIGLQAVRDNGRIRVEESLPCDGTDGVAGYWHLQGEDALPAGVLTAPANPLPGDLRLFADLHSPFHTIRVNPEPVAAPGPTADSAYLQPEASRVALSNARGTVKLALTSGSCSRSGLTFDFDGGHAVGSGTWTLASASGSYEGATADGTFGLDASVLPGADNRWVLDLAGSIKVLQPELRAEVVRTYWGQDGIDYLQRQVGAVYRITNVGHGDSFGTQLTAASSPSPGASLIRILVNGKNLLIDGNTPLATFPRSLGDLASGASIEVTIVWQLPVPSNRSVCKLVILGCQIDTELTMSAPDALDLPTTHSAALEVAAPDLPPPL